MAVLDPVCWHAVTPQLRALLASLGGQPFLSRFYLAGGTALALRLGHRRSLDLDFFSATDDLAYATRQEILRALGSLAPQTLEEVDGSLALIASGVHITFFSYGYPLLASTDEADGIPLASLIDIGLMKLDALMGRGSRKDFYDLYVISQHISPRDLLLAAREKYPHARDFELMALESLVLFDQANHDPQPEMLIDLPWDQVRRFFVTLGQTLGNEWLVEPSEP